MERIGGVEGAKVVLLPRNRKQGDFLRAQWPHWFIDDRTIIPAKALDGLNLIFNSDLVVSGGGTMNREAAALGIPVYSIFRGKIGAVDRNLNAEGRLVLIESAGDVEDKILLVKRQRKNVAEVTSTTTLHHIVDHIEEIAERCSRSL
jgi:predicted glycosyltransferase